MQPMLNIAIKAARNAGRVITRMMDRLETSDISEKSRGDYVSRVDNMAEAEIIQVIHQAYPNHSILAEESGFEQKDEKFCWIIDPLDGTTNYIHGLPHFAISIALKVNNKIELGVIYDPLRQELFTAIRGRGAQLNNRRIRVSHCKQLEKSLLGTGFPIRQLHHLAFYLRTFESILPATSGVRRSGSAALDLAYVAAGRFDGFWELALKPWDIAAGILLVTEAGGLIADFHNKQDYFDNGQLIAANPKIYKSLTDLIHQSLKEMS